MIGYCVKCREKRNMLNPTMFISKNNRKMAIAKCGVCNTNFTRLMGVNTVE